MKVSRSEILSKNDSLIRSIIPDIRQGDTAELIGTRVGGRVTVSSDNISVRELTVGIRLNSVISVTKGATMEEITSLINTAVGSGAAFGALGTSLKSGLVPAAGVAGATVRTLKTIMTTQQSEDTLRLLIPVRDLAGEGTKLNMSTSITGWTRTTDWDTDEIANFSHTSVISGKRSLPVKTENVGKEAQIQLKNEFSDVSDIVFAPAVDCFVDMAWNLKTDGAFSHDTISLIQVADLTVELEEIPPI